MPDERLANVDVANSDNDWRKSDSPSDLLFAADSQYSYDDFSNRAKIYESAKSDSPLNIDLFIRNIEVRLEEHIQVSNHVAESFGITCFGKAPMRVTFSGILADSPTTRGKVYLVDAYKNKLRLGAVARKGNIPVLEFGTHAVQGPFLSMQISESGDSQDTLVVVFTMLVTALQVAGPGKPVLLDYVHGVESKNPDDFIGNPLGLTDEDMAKTSDPEVKSAPDKAESTSVKRSDSAFVGPPKPPYLNN